MLAPAAAAQVIMDWYRQHQSAALLSKLVELEAAHPLLEAADRLAEAADSPSPDECRSGTTALFGDLVEALNDGFDPLARAVYARIFGRVVWTCCQQHPALRDGLAAAGIADERGLLARHAAVRSAELPLPDAAITRIAVLSRVTLGADVLLTSIMLQRLHQRWPEAELVVIGDGKLGGLLGGLAGVRIVTLRYTRRGPLGERLGSWLDLRRLVDELAVDLVVAPDSRLDQLGLLPVIDAPERYLLWENTQPESTAPRSLATLADAWCVQRLGLPAIPACRPRVAFDAATEALRLRWRAALGPGVVAVKLDHGGNPAKALPRAGELDLLRELRDLGWRILIDYGFGDEELAASDALMAELGWKPLEVDDSGRGGHPIAQLKTGGLASAEVIRFHGSIAGWAAGVAECQLAVSYDSVGHHLAAALGVPLVSIFTGHTSDTFPIAWKPMGPGPVQQLVIPSAERDDPVWWRRVSAALPSAPPA